MRILMMNIAGIGDFFEIIRWLYLLKEQKPHYFVDLLVSDRVYSYAKDCPYVDNVYFLRTSKTHVPLNLYNMIEIKKLLRNNYSFVINTFPSDSIFGDLKFMLLRVFLSKSSKIIGAVKKGRLSVYDVNLYIDRIRYDEVFKFLGVEDKKINIDLLWRENFDFSKYYFLKNFVLISPFSNSESRNLDLNVWIGLIEFFVETYNIVLLGNDFEKLKILYDMLSNKSKEKTFVVSDANLYELIFLIENSNFILSVDTSIPHISSLVNKLSFVLIKNMDYEIHKPYNLDKVLYLALNEFKDLNSIIFEVQKNVNL